MSSGWQLWLSPRPSRSFTANESSIWSAYDGTRFDFFKDEKNRWVIRETHFVDNPWVKKGLSGPILHIHTKQTERFQIEQGTIAIHKNGEENEYTKEDGIIMVPAGTRNNEDLIFKVWAEPQEMDHSFDERFIRNLIGYLRDCQLAKMEPSIFQLALICYDNSTLGALPFWVPLWLLSVIQYIMAYVIGGMLLGYKPSYVEYCNGS